jgi:hypothetical protein
MWAHACEGEEERNFIDSQSRDTGEDQFGVK